MLPQLRSDLGGTSGPLRTSVAAPPFNTCKPLRTGGKCYSMNMFYYAHVPYHRQKPKLPTHFWLLQSVLNEYIRNHEARTPITSILQRYVVAMSCGKIDTRLNSPISKRFIASLKRIDPEKIPLPSHMGEGLKSTRDEDVRRKGRSARLLVASRLFTVVQKARTLNYHNSRYESCEHDNSAALLL